MDELNLDQDKRRILEEFRKNVSDVLKPSHDDRFLLRWLRARNYNLTDAEKMLRADVKFRKKLGSDTILDTFELRKELQQFKFTVFLGFDNYGHPVRFFNFASCDLKGVVRCANYMELTQYLVSLMESDLKHLRENNEKNGTHVETIVFILDYMDFKLRDFTDRRVLEIGINTLKMLQDYYPEILHSIYTVNVPAVFYSVFNLFKPFLNEKVLQKIHIYAHDGWEEEIFSIIPREIVPAYLGGKRYGPGEDPFCNDLIFRGQKIPPSMYLTDYCTLKAGSNGVCEEVILQRSAFEVETDVSKPGSLLCWEFQTKRHNIRFGLFFTRNKKNQEKENSSKEELLPFESTVSPEIVERGDYLCKKAGSYILLFDNTNSWFRTKHLLYKTEVKPPSEATFTQEFIMN